MRQNLYCYRLTFINVPFSSSGVGSQPAKATMQILDILVYKSGERKSRTSDLPLPAIAIFRSLGGKFLRQGFVAPHAPAGTCAIAPVTTVKPSYNHRPIYNFSSPFQLTIRHKCIPARKKGLSPIPNISGPSQGC